MKQIINLPSKDVSVDLIESPIPSPKAHQILIKVVVSGSNPKDWKCAEWAVDYDGPEDTMMGRAAKGVNQGDDIAGIVEKVGDDVLGFKPGDRVAAFHEMCAPGGSYAEYGLAWDHTTFHIPDSVSFEEAATIPLAALTAAVALHKNLQLPTPWLPTTTPTPLVIYGASTAVGSFAIKLARASNIHPIIAIAGNGAKYVETLLDTSKGDAIFDYREGPDETIRKIRSHLDAGKYGQPKHGLDPGIGQSTQKVLTEVVAKDGAINLVLPAQWDTGSVVKTLTSVGTVHNQDNGVQGPDATDLGLVTCRWFTKGLQAGTFKGHPFEVRPGGLQGVQQALKDLKDGKASAVKYVFRIAETPGL